MKFRYQVVFSNKCSKDDNQVLVFSGVTTDNPILVIERCVSDFNLQDFDYYVSQFVYEPLKTVVSCPEKKALEEEKTLSE